jgi:hypothetical protein
MKSITKVLLIGAIAVMTIALTAIPSEAAKKKKGVVKASAGCSGVCATHCEKGTCNVNVCGVDGQWHIAILTPVCIQNRCPPPCG